MFILRILIVLFVLSKVNGLTCDKQLCTAEHKSCRIEVNENQVECTIECSTKNGKLNQCTYEGGRIECLCGKEGCLENKDVVANWRVQMEDNHGPFVTDELDKCLETNGMIRRSEMSCNGQKCYEERELSCQFDIQKGRDCTASCSTKWATQKCKKLGDDYIRCSCFGSNCHKDKLYWRLWKESASELSNDASGVDDCLYKTGALSKRKCGDVDCLFGKDESCELVVPSVAEDCTFECSTQKYNADTCKNGACYCEKENCYQQEETVTKWRKDMKKSKDLDSCLVKQNVLSSKECGGNKCFKNKDKSCILALKLDGTDCDVECSAEAATNQCRLENGTMECSSATDDFRMNKPLIQHLKEQRSRSKFNDGLEKCLQQKGMLKNETCGDETCFFGHDHCELLLNEKGSKIGCTTKKGSSCTEINSRGSYQYECLCEGQNCLKQEAMITELMKVQRKMKFSRTLEASLIRKDILTTKSCGGNKCFVGFDGLCKVEARLSGNCDLGCSKKTNAIDKCELINNETIIQCFCEEDHCHREKSRVNKWQKEVEAMHPTLTSKMEKCLHDKGDLKKSFKCGHQQCYKGRDTCKLEARNGTCSMECSTENRCGVFVVILVCFSLFQMRNHRKIRI